MNRVRKATVYLFALLLFGALINTAVFTSTNATLTKPEKIESYLGDSQIYSHFISYVTDQAEKALGDNDQSGTVSLSDAAIQSAAEAAFPKEFVQSQINAVIDTNYSWLEGKTSAPNFRIDLTTQKQEFAKKVGEYAKTYVATLPVCTTAQQVQQNTGSILSATCRPAELTPESAQALVTEQVASAGNYLANPVITPANINPDAAAAAQPYYDKPSSAPDAYQTTLKLPYVLAGFSVLFALAVVFISRERRKGLRLVGIVLLLAGTSLVAVKFIANAIFKHAETRIFNDSTVGQLQRALTDFAQRVETSVVRTELWFGIAFLLMAAIIFGILAGTRKSGDSKSSAPPPELHDENGNADEAGTGPVILARKRLKPPLTGVPNGPKLGGEPPAHGAPGTAPKHPEDKPHPKKKPRLIQ